jgi:hypothetical protein
VNLIRERAEEVKIRTSTEISPDPGDDPFCLCAEQGRADFVVTLNPKDFPQDRLKATVVLPETTDCAPLTNLDYPENPTLDLCHFPFSFRQVWPEKSLQRSIQIPSTKPFGGGERVLLMSVPAIALKAVAPKRRVNFDHRRLACGYLPAVKWPEVFAVCQAISEV